MLTLPAFPSLRAVPVAAGVSPSPLLPSLLPWQQQSSRQQLQLSSPVRQCRRPSPRLRASRRCHVGVAAMEHGSNNTTSMRIPKPKIGKKDHHLWMKRDSAGSGQKALHLVQIVSNLPNDKETIYGALDKWSAFEIEFPVVAAAKALGILRKRKQWLRLIQVGKWLLSKGQCMTMGTYDLVLLAFDMDRRIDEAEFFWNTILQKYTRSIPKRMFSRMISLYDHHRMPEKILEVFADMEELGVKPDEDTVRRIAKAFETLGKHEEMKEVYRRYGMKWKYIHFNGERVRVKTNYAE